MKHLNISWLIFLAAATLFACNQPAQPTSPAVDVPSMRVASAATDTSWLLSLQVTSVASTHPAYGAVVIHKQPRNSPAGALPAVSAQWEVEPYFANLAMTGLLEANPGDLNVKTAVKRWLQWYFKHMGSSEPTDSRCASQSTRNYLNVCDDVPGSVSLHFVNPSNKALTKVVYMDSSDSYAATFLTLLHKYYLNTQDKAFLVANRSKIRLARDVMMYRTWSDTYKRTLAKPSYPIDYLMDNAEVYEGLIHMKAMEAEVQLLNTTQAAATNEALLVQYRINDIQLGIEALFHVPSGLYFSNGDALRQYQGNSSLVPKLDVFYPDATAQLFPIWTGVISPSSQRAKDLWYKFNLKWDVMGSPDHQWTAGKTTVLEPWMVMTYTASLMKDPDSTYRAVNHLNWFDSTYGTSHQLPSFNAEAGWSLRARAELLKP